VELVAKIDAGHRAEIARLVTRVAGPLGAHGRDESVGERRANRLHDDEPLPRDARLARVHEPRRDARGNRDLQVRILEDQVGIAPAQFEHGLLERAPRGRRDLTAGGRGSGEGDGPHAR
jgi:hypothetical protein